MNTRKKLLFITTRLFWPTNSGRKVSLYYYCKGLHEQYGYDIYLYSFLEAGQTVADIDKKPEFIKSVYIAKPISKYEKVKNLLTKSFSIKKWPLQCSLFYSKENRECIRAYCNEIKPDVVMGDMIRTAPYISAFEDLSCKKILDMDDLLSKRYERQINSAFSQGNVTGQYGKNMPGMLNKIINSKSIKKAVLSIECKRLEKAEIQYARQYDNIIFVSDNETDYLNQKLGIQKAFTITMGVDYKYYSKPVTVEKEKGTLSFVGNMNVAANVDTLHMIAENILPRIKHKVVLKVIGTCPDTLRSTYANRKDIVFCGMVDDLRRYVCSTEVFLAPIAYGSGIKTKILEAMAMGIPVVTNSVGIEGITAENNKHLICSDNSSGIAAGVDLLLENQSLCYLFEQNAKALISDRYTWTNIWGKMNSLF